MLPKGPHQAAGYVTPLAGCLVSWPLACLLFASFYLYETLEWLHFWWVDRRPDKVYRDCLEYNVPLFIASALLVLWGIIS